MRIIKNKVLLGTVIAFVFLSTLGFGPSPAIRDGVVTFEAAPHTALAKTTKPKNGCYYYYITGNSPTTFKFSGSTLYANGGGSYVAYSKKKVSPYKVITIKTKRAARNIRFKIAKKVKVRLEHNGEVKTRRLTGKQLLNYLKREKKVYREGPSLLLQAKNGKLVYAWLLRT